MKCPFCQHPNTQVLDTRESDEGDVIRRRRRCEACDRRCTTFERVDLAMPIVVKKNGSRTEYMREKLHASMMIALRKRPVSAESLDSAILHIEEKLRAHSEREILSEHVGELVMRELKKLDKVAYVRFASVYRSFEDVADFAAAAREFR